MGVTRQNRTNYMLGQKNREGGFTLIEMMIITAIIGTTTALAVPSYINWNAKYQLRQAATEIQNQLSLARISAMSRNSVVNVSLVLSGGKVQVSAGDASGASVIPATQMMGSVTGLNPAPTTVAFSPLGIRSGGGAGNQQISISNNQGLSYSVRVTPRGKVSWCPAAACP
jgi:Tfp pilus assembly protein FimT